MCGSTKQVESKGVWVNTEEWGQLLGLVGSCSCNPPTDMRTQHPTCAHWQKRSLHMSSYARPSSDCCLYVCTNDHNAHPFPNRVCNPHPHPTAHPLQAQWELQRLAAHLAQPPPLWPAVAGRHTGRGSGHPTGAAPAPWAPSRAASPTGAPPSRTQPPPQPAPARTLCST